jgi:outer membrane murein-binding lipoprotein Lpp
MVLIDPTGPGAAVVIGVPGRFSPEGYEVWEWLGGAAVGGVFTVAIREAASYWRARLTADRETEVSDEKAAAALRDELRAEVRRLAERVVGLETDVDQWRRSYWQVVEEREALRGEVRALRQEVEALRQRVARDEQRLDRQERSV